MTFSFFFFQAEDGIRDIGVTGVQTCALPISGAADDLGPGALLVNPFDTAELAETIAAALELSPDERAKRAALLREGATTLPPQDWFAVQREQLAGAVQTPG